jgi:hypothetical protein
LSLSFNSPNIPEFITCIDLLRSMGGDNGPAECRAFMQQALGGLTRFEYIKESPVCPAAVAAVLSPRVGVLCVHGTDLDSQYLPQITGWLNGLLARGGPAVDFPVNPWIRTAANQCRLLANRVGVWAMPAIWVIGHSAGHGISTDALSNAIDLQDVTGGAFGIYAVSFGGNGFANRATIATLSASSVQCVRWMVAEDPVPLFPWCCTQMLGGNTFLAPDTLQAILNVQHINGGRNLPATGDWQDRTLPSAASVSPAQSVVGWLRTIESGADNPHKTAEYRRRILALPVPAQPVVVIQDTGPRIPVYTASDAPLNIPIPPTRAAAATQLDAMVATSQEAAAAVPPSPPVISPGNPFVARRGNGVWGVERDGIQVATPGDKKGAHDLARKLNRLERDIDAINDEDVLETVAFLTS